MDVSEIVSNCVNRLTKKLCGSSDLRAFAAGYAHLSQSLYDRRDLMTFLQAVNEIANLSS